MKILSREEKTGSIRSPVGRGIACQKNECILATFHDFAVLKGLADHRLLKLL